MNRVLILIGTALIFFSACKKVDDTTSAEEDMRNGTWKRSSGFVIYKDAVTRGDSTQRYDVAQDNVIIYRPDLMAPLCWGDNYLQFQAGNVGTLSLGTTVCTPSDPPTRDFQWQITNDEKHMSIYNAQDYFPTAQVDADIITRTLGFLTIQYRVVRVDSIYHTFDTLTYRDVLRRQ